MTSVASSAKRRAHSSPSDPDVNRDALSATVDLGLLVIPKVSPQLWSIADDKEIHLRGPGGEKELDELRPVGNNLLAVWLPPVEAMYGRNGRLLASLFSSGTQLAMIDDKTLGRADTGPSRVRVCRRDPRRRPRPERRLRRLGQRSGRSRGVTGQDRRRRPVFGGRRGVGRLHRFSRAAPYFGAGRSHSVRDRFVSTIDQDQPQSFEEFWPYYVSQHRNQTCRQLHFVGTTIAMGCLAVSPLYPPAALAAPVAGYGFAWIGHFVFEKNKPASWGGVKAASRGRCAATCACGALMATGQMDAEVERVDVAAAMAAPRSQRRATSARRACARDELQRHTGPLALEMDAAAPLVDAVLVHAIDRAGERLASERRDRRCERLERARRVSAGAPSMKPQRPSRAASSRTTSVSG